MKLISTLSVLRPPYLYPYYLWNSFPIMQITLYISCCTGLNSILSEFVVMWNLCKRPYLETGSCRHNQVKMKSCRIKGALNPVWPVSLYEEGHLDTEAHSERRRPYNDRSRDYSDVCTSQGTPTIAGDLQKLEEAECLEEA